ncbi:MAG TPA: AGE family epimerase/isomerase, partial [Sphaerochaeta sp.]|nr:AGE family epimerase/isomerase [Sphaerochaeta sp.]
LRVLAVDRSEYDPMFEKLLNHAVAFGVDWKHGGVFVEGSLDGSKVYDRSKEFWQQAEFLIGMLDAYRFYGDEKYLAVYENVHRFVFDKMINHEVGEWLALLEEDGKPIWSHMSHSWKVNYHTIRSVVLSLQRLDQIEMQM